jgi:RNA polymerase sigma factor (TIGR02999 family)
VISAQLLQEVLSACEEDERKDLDQLFAEYYPRLKRVAWHELNRLRPDPHFTPTLLVNECYLRLKEGGSPNSISNARFFQLIARCMRCFLVDQLRYHSREKRSGRKTLLQESRIQGGKGLDLEVMDLDRALHRLAEIKPELADLTELRFFAGLTLQEIATLKKTNVSAVHRQWLHARSLLTVLMQENEQDGAAEQ